MTTGEKALKILRFTNDGKGLKTQDMMLLREAVNHRLDKQGLKEFNKLYIKIESKLPSKSGSLFVAENCRTTRNGREKQDEESY